MTDTFRKKYHALEEKNAKIIIEIKTAAETLESLIKQFQSREISLALTKLEECTMWATKGVVLHDEREQLNSSVAQ